MDDAAIASISLIVNALWNQEKSFASTVIDLRIFDSVTLTRDGDLRSAIVPVYYDLRYGYAGKLKMKEQVMGAVDELAEEFANKYLTAQEKENLATPKK